MDSLHLVIGKCSWTQTLAPYRQHDGNDEKGSVASAVSPAFLGIYVAKLCSCVLCSRSSVFPASVFLSCVIPKFCVSEISVPEPYVPNVCVLELNVPEDVCSHM